MPKSEKRPREEEDSDDAASVCSEDLFITQANPKRPKADESQSDDGETAADARLDILIAALASQESTQEERIVNVRAAIAILRKKTGGELLVAKKEKTHHFCFFSSEQSFVDFKSTGFEKYRLPYNKEKLAELTEKVASFPASYFEDPSHFVGLNLKK